MATPRGNVLLWTIQVLLAALFLFAGGLKLVMPIEAMTQGSPIVLPGWFLRFLGGAEVIGGLGLVLPGLFRTLPILIPIAAGCLMIIMAGATLLTPGVTAAIPFTVGVLLGVVVYTRSPVRKV